MGLFRFLRLFDTSLAADLERSREKEERRKAELEALDFVRVQRERRAEVANLAGQKEKLEALRRDALADPILLGRIENELHLKEKLLTSDVLTIERNVYNAAILDAYDAETQEVEKVSSLKSEIKKMERAGEGGPQIEVLKRELEEKENWMKKDVLGKLWDVQEE